MSRLNSFLVTLTSVEPHNVPFTVISIVSLAVACFLFFYLFRAIKIVNSLKNTPVQLLALKAVPQRNSLHICKICLSALSSNTRGMSLKSRYILNASQKVGKKNCPHSCHGAKLQLLLRTTVSRYPTQYGILQAPARYSDRCGYYRYILRPDDWPQPLRSQHSRAGYQQCQ